MNFLQDIFGMVIDDTHVEDHRNGPHSHMGNTEDGVSLTTKNKELQPVDISYDLGHDNPLWPRVRD